MWRLRGRGEWGGIWKDVEIEIRGIMGRNMEGMWRLRGRVSWGRG